MRLPSVKLVCLSSWLIVAGGACYASAPPASYGPGYQQAPTDPSQPPPPPGAPPPIAAAQAPDQNAYPPPPDQSAYPPAAPAYPPP